LIKLIDSESLRTYLSNDWIASDLQSASEEIKNLKFTGDRWMMDSPPKRMIYAALYGDLLRSKAPRKLLDVGGGFSGLSKTLAVSTDYKLVEICAHETADQIQYIKSLLGEAGLVAKDWNEYFAHGQDTFDVIVANDLFPNVDQRLDLFLSKALPRCRELRLSLTFYNEPRYYQVKRMDGDEVFWYLAWNYPLLRTLLEPFQNRMSTRLETTIPEMPKSLYANGRQVLLVSMKGDLS
jgi:hypothetical protein